MDTRNQGAAAEYIVAAFFLRRCYSVLWPAAEGLKYDLAVEQPGIMLKIQVKKVTRSSTGRLRVMCSGNGSRKGRRMYKQGDFDMLAAVDGFRIWLIPYRDIATTGMLTLDTPATEKWLQKG